MYQENILDIKNYLDEYNKVFSNMVPLIMVKDNLTEEKLVARIVKAIKTEEPILANDFIYFIEEKGDVI